MLRSPGLRSVLLALALASLPLGACNSGGNATTSAASTAEPSTPLPAPAGHVGDLFVPTPGATWTALRESFGGPALFLPQSFGSLVTTLVGMPITMSAEIDEAVPVVGAAARLGKGPIAFAVGVHVKAGDRFVDQLTRGEAARFDATVDQASRVTLLTDKIAPESMKVSLGVLKNYLLIGRTPADLYALGPYVVRTLAAAPPPKEPIAIELPEQALAGPVREALADMRGRAEGSSAAIVPLGGMLDDASAVLGDAKHARFVIDFDRASLHARFAVTPKPGSAGEKLVAATAIGDVKPLLELPDSTTIAVLWRESSAARAENTPKQAEALARLLGKGGTDEDRAAIAAALRAGVDARGDWQALGVAFNGSGPSAVVRAPVRSADDMKKALKQLVDAAGTPSLKKALAGFGFKLSADKAVVENVAGEVGRVRLSRGDDEAKSDKKDAKPEKKDAKADKGDAKAKSAEKGEKGAPAAETPKAIDLLYLVDDKSLYVAAGYDPKDSLRALLKAPTGPNLGGVAPMASALSAIGNDASFVLVADALRINAMTTGANAPAVPTPLVIAAGRTAPDLWARADLPFAVVQQLAQEYMRRQSAPRTPPPAPSSSP
jgi:hypothetical protein